MKKAITIIIIIILLPILFVNCVILINSVLNPYDVPSFFGWKPFIVLSGSMETSIYAGDMVFVKDVGTDNLKENDIIAFRSGDVIITHRIIEIKKDEDGKVRYVTKGDNNNAQDTSSVYPENVEGLYQFRISNLGNLAMFMQTPTGMLSCLSIPVLLLIIVHMRESAEDKKYIKEKITKQKEMEQELERLRKQNENLENNRSKD